MRYSEIITVYLAVGAPFAAEHLLKETRAERLLLRLLRAACMMLLWPLALSLRLMRGRLARRGEPVDEAAMMQALNRAEQAKESLLASLYAVHELAREARNERDGPSFEQETRAVCESIERYTGLTLAASAVDFNGPPSGRELELCRVAGRTGEDLLLAGRCIHRRNSAQLLAHRERSRTELLKSLASVREFGANETRSASIQKGRARRHLSVAVIKFYGHAINLLSVLEDEGAVLNVARLLDAECARLRRLESDTLPDAVHEGAAEGGVWTPGQLSTQTQPPGPRLSPPAQMRGWTRNAPRA